MSSPIQPPGGGSSGPPEGPGAPKGPSGSGEADVPSRPEESFQERLDATEASGAATRGAAAQAAGVVGEVVAELRAGRIEPSEALDRLVQRALAAPEAQALSPALRSELEAHLRRTLADDPAFAGLVRDLERGR